MTVRIFIAVLAALIVVGTIGAVLAIVAIPDDDDSPTRTHVATTVP